MSVQSEITRLVTAKEDIKNALIEKGVAVADTDLLDVYADHVRSIEVGGAELATLQEMIGKVPTRLTAEITATSGKFVKFMYCAGTKIITWGDGTINFYDPNMWGANMAVSHTYSANGKYTINIYGAKEIASYFASGSYPPMDVNKWLKEVYISDEATFVGDYAFYNANVLNKCILSNTMTGLIGSYIFTNTPSLLEITIPVGITTIYAMQNTSFQRVIFPHTTPPTIVNQMSSTPFGASAKPIIPSANLRDVYFNKWWITTYCYELVTLQ